MSESPENALYAALEHTRFCGRLPADDRRFLADYLTRKDYGPSESIFEEGEHSAYLAILLSGEVNIVKFLGESLEKHVVTLRAGSHFGDMSFLDGEPRSASAEARTAASLAILTPAGLDRVIAAKPALGINILRYLTKTISNRLRRTTCQLVGLT
jgi:CRP/FNR family transcriptional regulator, cyclic AMP receptor protein